MGEEGIKANYVFDCYNCIYIFRFSILENPNVCLQGTKHMLSAVLHQLLR